MAGFFACRRKKYKILDPGAGFGILSAAFIRRLLLKQTLPVSIDVVAFEIDQTLIQGLNETYRACAELCRKNNVDFSFTVHNKDFIEYGANFFEGDLFSKPRPLFDAIIVNPPYGKLSASSDLHFLLKKASMERTNLYTAFLGIAIELLKDNGEMVAITPRSFCNGPYFKSFRQNLLKTTSILSIHSIDSRKTVFKNDRVLQETIIFHVVKKQKATSVIRISNGSGMADESVLHAAFPTNEIISPSDLESFIHIPTYNSSAELRTQINRFRSSLGELGLQVSTGRVVDFRVAKFLGASGFVRGFFIEREAG